MSMPLWSILAAPLACAGLCFAGRTPRGIRAASILGAGAALGVCAAWAWSILQGGPAGGRGGLRLDALGAYLALIISLLALAASLASAEFMEREAREEGLGVNSWRVYYGLLHLFTASMLLVPISDNLGILWVAVEATTLSSAFLVGFHRHRHSVEAAWKYVILCSVGIAFAFLGTILLYYAGTRAGGSGLDWSAFMAIAPRMDPKIVSLAFLFAALGYGTKAGLAPMHTWLPDAHSQAPSPVSAMLSGVLLPSAFYALARFYAVAAPCVGTAFLSRVFILFGLCSLAIAAPFILVARDYKRMLAYSSVEHMGFLALGLGIGTPLAVYGTFLHLLCHALAKGLGFLSAGRILHAFGTRKITKVSGAFEVSPDAGIVFFAAILALSGLPPSGLFISEVLVLSEGFSSGRAAVSLPAAALLVTAFAGLLFHAARMCFGAARRAPEQAPGQAAGILLPAALLLTPLLVLGCWIPEPMDAWLREMVRLVLGGAHG